LKIPDNAAMRNLVVLSILTAALAACGIKGALYLPAPAAKPASAPAVDHSKDAPASQSAPKAQQ